MNPMTFGLGRAVDFLLMLVILVVVLVVVVVRGGEESELGWNKCCLTGVEYS
jgi:hypothetical protein